MIRRHGHTLAGYGFRLRSLSYGGQLT